MVAHFLIPGSSIIKALIFALNDHFLPTLEFSNNHMPKLLIFGKSFMVYYCLIWEPMLINIDQIFSTMNCKEKKVKKESKKLEFRCLLKYFSRTFNLLLFGGSKYTYWFHLILSIVYDFLGAYAYCCHQPFKGLCLFGGLCLSGTLE